eukprot:TRINITY_DN27767_c0_g1_i1.p1 TRINITY_DN27767_c0_g1~~TRINITY_DN27767_c0_g1_i1.p1  ORF type:complete len:285 (+),score=58.48 TRINITY_DN27767_c0_g1_i1:315-1169(+)
MSLLEECRGMQTVQNTRRWNRAIAKEQAIKARHVESADCEEEQRQTLARGGLAATMPSLPLSDGPRKTPQKHFRRLKDTIRSNRPDRQVGAFDANVSAAPGTGFLPKPNLFTPGAEPGLGPLPKKLVKGNYPASYVFARGDPRMGVMLWPEHESQDKATVKRERAAAFAAAAAAATEDSEQGFAASVAVTEPSLTASGSAPLLGSGTSPSRQTNLFGPQRPPSSYKAQIAEAREDAKNKFHQKDFSFGSSSWFLASKEHNPRGWSQDSHNTKRADSGRTFYWGC